MPTYDYSCRSCGARFEAWQKMTDDPITVCPTCGGDVHRVIYPVGLVFKGSGFYITDNHSSSANGNGHHAGASGDTQTDTPSAAASDSSTSAGASTGSEASSGAKAETTSKSAASATPASAGGAKE